MNRESDCATINKPEPLLNKKTENIFFFFSLQQLDNEVEKTANLFISNWNQQMKASNTNIFCINSVFRIGIFCFCTNIIKCFGISFS